MASRDERSCILRVSHMRFVDPLFLLGLLGIAVPLILHLLFRRRVPIVDFPLARLIGRAERSRQRTARR